MNYSNLDCPYCGKRQAHDEVPICPWCEGQLPMELIDPRKYRISENHQSIGELWQSLYNLAAHIQEDNENAEKYSIAMRGIQLDSLKSLISAIEESHKEYNQKRQFEKGD